MMNSGERRKRDIPFLFIRGQKRARSKPFGKSAAEDVRQDTFQTIAGGNIAQTAITQGTGRMSDAVQFVQFSENTCSHFPMLLPQTQA
ncbi:hypothetical protein [Beijerinckia mobilis]|uniref:hypothetical protein n=1 Tax=Beijerinckia mobilis TaxID=231434 RepID=UPI0005570EDE|nr:hypothetical protein [Beijerinckia mobilis]